MAELSPDPTRRIEEINDTTYKVALADDDNTKCDVEIGDRDAAEFRPHLKLNRWDGECYMKVGLPETVGSLQSATDSKITWESNDYYVEMYPLAANEQMDQGGYEYNIWLPKKPKTNQIALPIETRGLNFLYQPELTQQEIDEGASRPDNVVGSYAVYHATKGGAVSSKGKNYRCGKAFHIFRPKLVDDRGNWTWAELGIFGGYQTITIPQKFLDEAIYPIKHAAGDTFGYTTAGSSYYEMSGTNVNIQSHSSYNLPADGTATSMSVYSKEKNDGYPKVHQLGIYNTSSPNAKEGNTESVSIDSTTPQWWVPDVSGTVNLTSGDYVLCFWGQSAGGLNVIYLYYDTGDVDSQYKSGESPFSWPATITWSTWATRKYKYSIYCTYTPSGGGTHETVNSAVEVGVTAVASRVAAATRTASAPYGISTVAYRNAAAIRNATAQFGVTAVGLMAGVGKFATAPYGISTSASRSVAATRTATAPYGLSVTASLGVGKFADVAVGVTAVATRTIAATRTASTSIGVTAVALMGGISKAASVAVGVTAVATRAVAASRSASVAVGVTAVASRIIGATRTAATAVGVAVSASGVPAYIGNFVTASIAYGISVTASRNVAATKAASVAIGISVSAVGTAAYISHLTNEIIHEANAYTFGSLRRVHNLGTIQRHNLSASFKKHTLGRLKGRQE